MILADMNAIQTHNWIIKYVYGIEDLFANNQGFLKKYRKMDKASGIRGFWKYSIYVYKALCI